MVYSLLFKGRFTEGFVMATFSPTIENIKRLKVKPTEGELFLLEQLEGSLDESFEVYFNPFLDGDRPDIIILKQGVGAFVIEVKDWNLAYYKVDSTNRWHVDDKKGNKGVVKSPMAQAYTYKKNLYDLHLPVLGIAELSNRNFYNVVHCFVYMHKTSDFGIRSFCEPALKDVSDELKNLNQDYQRSNKTNDLFKQYEKSRNYWDNKKRALNRDRGLTFTTDSVDRLINKIKNQPKHILFEDRIYDDFDRRLQATEHTKKQGVLPKFDDKQRNIAESSASYSKVKGVAGCGKTSILAARAVNALDRHNGQVLILTFNITLRNLIKDKLSDIQGYRNNSRIEVTNYHTFFGVQANNAGIDLHSHIEKYTFERAYDIDIFKYVEGLQKYKTILLDEVQDYKPEWVKIVRDNFLDEEPEMVLFGDQAQNIYGRDEGRTSVIVQGFGRWNQLNKNYRTAESSPLKQFFRDFQLGFLLEKYVDTELMDVPQQQLGLGLESGEIQYVNLAGGYPTRAFDYINSFIRKHTANPNEVAILGTKISEMRLLSELYTGYEKVTCMYETYDEIAAYPLIKNLLAGFRKCTACQANPIGEAKPVETLKSLCIDCIDKFTQFEDINVDKIRRRKKTHFYMNSGLIKFSTTHSFKGLEASLAFYLLGRDDEPELAYTTLTRSIEHLVVIDFSETNRFDQFFRSHATVVEI